MVLAYYCAYRWTSHRCWYVACGLRNGIDILGTNFMIEWTPSSNGTISLDLGTGSAANINIVMNIASGIPNTGVNIFVRSVLNCLRASNGPLLIRFRLEPTIQSRFHLGKYFLRIISDL